MEWVSRGYSALVGDAAQPQTGAETIDKLCDRVVNATLLEDRRAAVLGLKGLSRQYQLEVGTKAMPILLHILHQDRVDAEMTKAILETLIHLCNTGQSTDEDTTATDDLGVQFTEIFVKDANNISLLLSVLVELDFHVRYNAIELFKILLKNRRKQLQDCILTSPMGVSRLMDLLEDQREVIRNEGLLLLIDLTDHNPDIQKIIAFENAFERLLQIVYSEGACEGDMIVQDCLQLMHNLLKDNVSNQNYFRESGLLTQLPPIFGVHDDPAGATYFSKTIIMSRDGESLSQAKWSAQKMRNVTMALSVVQIFVGSRNPNVSNNQTILFSAKLFHPILQLGLANNVPPLVRAGALYTVAYSISENQKLQDFLGQCVVRNVFNPGEFPSPVINEIISLSVTTTPFTKPDFLLRAASAFLMQNYLLQNPDAQNFLIKTLTPPPAQTLEVNGIQEDIQSAGSLLLTSVMDWESSRKDPFRAWFATMILANIMADNPKCKELALKLTVGEIHEEDSSLDLLNLCAHAAMVCARENADIRVQIGFLCFLATWLYDFPPAVKRFLEEGANFSFLIELISHSSSVDPVVQGLAAFLMCVCFESNADNVSGLTRSAIQSIILSRVGADQFINRLNRLKESRYFGRYSLEGDFDMGQDRKNNFPDVYFDIKFVEFYKSVYESMQKSVLNPKSLQAKEPKKEANSHENKIHLLQSEVDRLKEDVAYWKAKYEKLEQECGHMKELSQKSAPTVAVITTEPLSVHPELELTKAEVVEWKSKYDGIQHELEDLLVCLAEQDLDMKRMRARLRELGDVLEEEDDEDGDDQRAETNPAENE